MILVDVRLVTVLDLSRNLFASESARCRCKSVTGMDQILNELSYPSFTYMI
jgi:hypothetical protein